MAISASLDLANNTDYTVLAVGDGGNQPLALLPLVDDNRAPPAGQFAPSRLSVASLGVSAIGNIVPLSW